MKSGSRAAGFTIIEILIVLAVSMAMFLAAAVLISGKQNHTEFGQGVRQVQQQLQQTINEVSNGYYTSDESFKCVPGVGGPHITQTPATDRGTNAGCIFFGKAMQFAVDKSGSPTNPEEYISYTMVGLSGNEDGVANADFSSIKPILIANDLTYASSSPDLFDTFTMPFGMTVYSMDYADASSSGPIGAVGFAPSIGGFGGDTSQQVNVIAIKGNLLHKSQAQGVTSIDKAINTATPITNTIVTNPSGGIHLCVKSGGTQESALYTIGGNGRNTTVSVNIKGNMTCS